jgi:hypothetical protein
MISKVDEIEREIHDQTRLSLVDPGIDILLPQQFVSLIRGNIYVRHSFRRRECRIELIAKHPHTGADKVAAIFGCCGFGSITACEVALLNTGKHVLIWKRKGNESQITLDGRFFGRVHLGWLLQHAYIGSGTVWISHKPFCKFKLPVFGPSSPQSQDCTGKITLPNDRQGVKFIINSRDTGSAKVMVGSVFRWAWARLFWNAACIPKGAQPGAQSDGDIFYRSDEARLAQLTDEQRLVILALAVWPWSLYKGGGT